MRWRTLLLATVAMLIVDAVAAPSSGPPPLAVRVVARDGAPIAGAVVEVSPCVPEDGRVTGFWRSAPVERWDAATRRPSVVASVQAAADGTASVAGLRAATWTLTASKPGWARGVVFASLGDDAETRTATVVLDRGRALAGRVFDADGKPVVGATMFAGSPGWNVPGLNVPAWNCAGGDPSLVSTTSGADGSYRLDDLPVDDVVLWIAPPRGLAAPWATLDLHTVTTFDVRLEALREPVTGTVLDAATGEPIVDALVRVEAADGPHASAASAVTDERGRYAVDGLRAPRFERLLVEKGGYATVDRYGFEAQTSAVRLASAARLVGTVRGPDGPVAGAYVHAGLCGRLARSDRAQRRGFSVVTDADGRYVVDRLAPGLVVVEVAAAGLVSPWPVRGGGFPSEDAVPGPDVVTLTADGEATLDVAMSRGRTLHAPVIDAGARPGKGVRVEGRVRAANGAPLRDLRVELVPCWDEFNEREFPAPIELQVDADGRFAGSVPRRGFRVRAAADGLAAAISREHWSDSTAKPDVVDLVLGEGCAFAGRVIDSTSGKPLRGAIVSSSERHAYDHPYGKRSLRPPFMPLHASGERVVAVTDADGRFRVPALFRREYDFSIAAQGHETRRMKWDASDPASAARDVDVRLDDFAAAAAAAVAPRPSSSICGVVRDADGRAVNGVEVCALPSSSVDPRPRGVGRSDDRGVFTIDGLDVGATFRLVTRREGVLPTEVRDVASGAKNVAVAVVRVAEGPASTISGRARRADGTFFINVRLRFTHVGDAQDVEWAETGHNPFFRRPFLLPGEYRVDVATYGPDTLVEFVDLGVVATGTNDVVLTATR